MRPIRKRGFHRAIKRDESWAVLDMQMQILMKKVSRTIFENQLKPNPFIGWLDMFEKDKK